MTETIDEYIDRVQEHVIKQDEIERREMDIEIAVLFVVIIFYIVSIAYISMRYGM